MSNSKVRIFHSLLAHFNPLSSSLTFTISILDLLTTMSQLTWLVTGCSSGIGENFVHAIIARGDRVIATARNATERLQYAKDAGAAILDLDITASQAELDAKVKEAIGIYGALDVLVNNAGYIEASLVEEARYGDCGDEESSYSLY